MLNKIKSYLILAATLFTFGVPVLVPVAVTTADCNNIGNQVSTGANIASGGPNSSTCGSNTGVGGTDLANIAKEIVNIFSIVVGAVAVIMIIYGGFRYITSGGDSGSVGNAKNTIIYAIVGLVIVALAQIIVHFVLNTASSAVTQ